MMQYVRFTITSERKQCMKMFNTFDLYFDGPPDMAAYCDIENALVYTFIVQIVGYTR